MRPFWKGTDTTIKGGEKVFPTTCWTQLLADVVGNGPGNRPGFELLAMSYWRPVYTYIRIRWAKTNEEAKDLTQDFFVWIMDGDFLAKADRARGRFRSFIKVALEHYLADSERKRRRQKRGGNHRFQPLDLGDGSAELQIPDARGRTPEEILDESWRAQVLSNALRRLEEELAAEDKKVCFMVFQDYYLSQEEKLNYREVAARHGVRANDVSNYLMQAKRRYRAALRAVIAETVQGEESLQEELKWMFGGLRCE